MLRLRVDELVVLKAKWSNVFLVTLNSLLDEILLLNDWINAKYPELIESLLVTGLPYHFPILFCFLSGLFEKRLLPFSDLLISNFFLAKLSHKFSCTIVTLKICNRLAPIRLVSDLYLRVGPIE